MTVEIPTIEPTRFRAGDTISWSKSLSDFPAESWVLHYRLINLTSKIDIDAAADDSDHLVTVSAVTSAAYKAGDYTWTSWVTKYAERYTVAQGKVTILPDLAAVTAAGFDTRSTAKKILDLIDAAELAHGPNAWTQEYEIAGRRMRFKTVGEFMAYRSRLEARVKAEERANGGRRTNKINVRF